MRERVRVIIEQVLEAELLAALGAAPSARVGDGRRGYRNGTPLTRGWGAGGAGDHRTFSLLIGEHHSLLFRGLCRCS